MLMVRWLQGGQALVTRTFSTAMLFILAVPSALHSQTTEHYEAILIDTSPSIARGRANKDLFQEYLHKCEKAARDRAPKYQRVGFSHRNRFLRRSE